MANPEGQAESEAVRVDFDRRLMLQFRGSASVRCLGCLAYREPRRRARLDRMAGRCSLMPARARTGAMRWSVCSGIGVRRLAGYEDVNDAEWLRHDPAMRWIVGGKAAQAARPRPFRDAAACGRYEPSPPLPPVRSVDRPRARSSSTSRDGPPCVAVAQYSAILCRATGSADRIAVSALWPYHPRLRRSRPRRSWPCFAGAKVNAELTSTHHRFGTVDTMD